VGTGDRWHSPVDPADHRLLVVDAAILHPRIDGGSGKVTDAAPTPRRLTSRDVAARAGVSQSIVSFYFTGKRPVSKDARARIETAIEELGYRPNRVAQSLRTQRTGQVAVFIPYISNPLYAAYAAGAELALAEAGYLTVIFSNRAVPAQLDDYFNTVADSRVDGLILFPFEYYIERM
jgi:DNA-binding LacI/PurR family transcriptional regulator